MVRLFLVLAILALSSQASVASEAANEISRLIAAAEQASRDARYLDAAKAWERVLEKNPNLGDHWQKLAQSLYWAKEYSRAIPAWKKVLELRNGFPSRAAYNVACCHAQLNEKEAALDWLERALKLGLRSVTSAQTDNDLKSIQSEPRFRELLLITDPTKLSRDEGWRFDLKYLMRELLRLHYNPYRQASRAEFDAEARRLHDAIPKLTDPEIEVAMMRIVQRAGDGHTWIRPAEPRLLLPLQLYQFEEGIYVTAAAPAHADLVGGQLVSIGGYGPEKLHAAIEPLVSRDNPMGVKVMTPALMTVPRILHGLGLIPKPTEAAVVVRGPDGKERSATLPASGARVDASWPTARSKDASPPLYLKNRNAPYWFEYLREHKAVYCQYNAVRNDVKEPFEAFCKRMFGFIDSNDVEKLVIDLRWNGGGNSFLNRPLIHGLIRCDKVNQAGKLYVVIGRQTFSAAQNCATDLEMHTRATFVGEPSGSSPNFIGETVRFSLPYSKMSGSISDLNWVRSWPMDYRIWIAPTLHAPPTWAGILSNRDPALDAILK